MRTCHITACQLTHVDRIIFMFHTHARFERGVIEICYIARSEDITGRGQQAVIDDNPVADIQTSLYCKVDIWTDAYSCHNSIDVEDTPALRPNREMVSIFLKACH
jgi:hypothetical protein